MNEIDEVVDLPDPDTHPLVHPLDIPQAKRPFVHGWLASAVGDPAIALSVAALVWFASRQVVAPILAGVSLLLFGAFAGRYLTEEAWAYIPRSRQDRRRHLPLPWEVGASLAFAVLLAAVLLLTVARLGQADVPLDVRSFTFGMAVGTAAVVVLGFVAEMVMRPPADRRRTWLTLPGVLVVAGSVAVAVPVWFGDAAAAWTPLSFSGMVVMALIGGAAGWWRAAQRRRDARVQGG